MKSVVQVLAIVAFIATFTKADSVLDNSDAQQQARTIFSSGGTYYLALNTTYLIYYGVLIGLGLLAILALASANSDVSYGSHSNYYTNRNGQTFEDTLYHRQKRSPFDNGKVPFYKKGVL